MKIGILGSGGVAQSLAAGFIGRGDSVMLGTRETAKLAGWKTAAGPAASVGSFADTAAFGEAIVLATLGTATVAAVEAAGSASFDGKVVIDVTNPLTFERGFPELTIGFNDSLGESVQRAIPKAKVVKAFNTVGAELMVNPRLPGGPPDMFMAGNDAEAKAFVAAIVRDFNWNVVDLGGIEQSRQLEALCVVWVQYGRKTGTFTHAFKLLHQQP